MLDNAMLTGESAPEPVAPGALVHAGAINLAAPIRVRLTRVAEDSLHYAFTVEDPTMWEKPWGGEYEFRPLGNPLYEYACHEGNYSLPNALSGARVPEQEAKDAPARPAAPGPASRRT